MFTRNCVLVNLQVRVRNSESSYILKCTTSGSLYILKYGLSTIPSVTPSCLYSSSDFEIIPIYSSAHHQDHSIYSSLAATTLVTWISVSATTLVTWISVSATTLVTWISVSATTLVTWISVSALTHFSPALYKSGQKCRAHAVGTGRCRANLISYYSFKHRFKIFSISAFCDF